MARARPGDRRASPSRRPLILTEQGRATAAESRPGSTRSPDGGTVATSTPIATGRSRAGASLAERPRREVHDDATERPFRAGDEMAADADDGDASHASGTHI
jgi:hypothetical protein